MEINIVLADDHPLLLEGTKNFLQSKGYQIIGTATNGNEAYNFILKHNPNVAIIDFDMPILNGLELSLLCKQKQIDVKIIMLTLYKQESILEQIGKTINAYILKEDALSELEVCIETVLKNENYVSKNINSSIFLPHQQSNLTNLTASEIKILKFIAKNYSSSEIASTLFISKRTVEKHRSNIIQKLKLDSSPNSLLLWIQKNHHLFNT